MQIVKWQRVGFVLLCAGALLAHGQLPGGGVGGGTPQFSAAFSKLFGEHKAFSADMDMELKEQGGQGLFTPGKIAYLDGKSRLEMDLSKAKGPQLPPGMADQLKTMGMAQMTMISEEGKTNAYLVYPALQAYAVLPTPDGKTAADDSKIKLDSTELGKETVDGQQCIKNRVVITEADGTKSEATVWNATELKKFPVRIETSKDQHTVRMSFKNVKLAKPDAKLFEPPAGFKKYENVQVMMQEVIMKSIQSGGAPK